MKLHFDNTCIIQFIEYTLPEIDMATKSGHCWCKLSIYVTGPAKIGHVGSQNLTTFQTFGSHNFLFKYGIATKISELVDNLFGFRTLLTESKYYISALRYVLSNDMVYFSPHALFSQAQSHIAM